MQINSLIFLYSYFSFTTKQYWKNIWRLTEHFFRLCIVHCKRDCPSELQVTCLCVCPLAHHCCSQIPVIRLKELWELKRRRKCVDGSIYLMKENCSSYMLGSRARLGYFPKGGTMRLKTRAMHTNTAGSTIWKDAFVSILHVRICKQTIQNIVWRPYLSKETFPGTSGVQEAFPEQSYKLLSLQTPALHLVRTFTISATQPVRLTRFCRCTSTHKQFKNNQMPYLPVNKQNE